MMPTEQKPIGSGYGPATTAQDVIAGTDLTRKVAIVTGGYSGMGLESARTLAEAGATVAVPTRTPDNARAALTAVPGQVTLGQLFTTWAVHDLNHLAQVVNVLARQHAEAVGPWRAFLGIVEK
jgi:NAD(P)-dependent dehydrogenase (short-subunit alcohol dehydrogenase family)